MRTARNVALAVLVCAVGGTTLSAQSRHPLDPLTWEEHWTLLEVLHEAGHVNDSTRFSLVTLHEPPKAAVWDWQPTALFPRHAFVIVKQQARTYEAVVDVGARSIASWKEIRGVQPSFLEEEFGAMESQVKRHPEFVEAMRRRGITDFTFIDCGGAPPGSYGLPEEAGGRRIAHWSCEDPRRVRNTWTRQIEGLTIVVDVNAREILRVIDEGPVPIPTTVADYDEASVGPLHEHRAPITMSQPLGPEFEIDGHLVWWDRWSFHVRPDQRVGAIISTVRYQDRDAERLVLYQGALSEIFVPYMDPSPAWYARNFLDAGEFPVGGLAKPLAPGIDCPGNAVYFDFVVVRDNGRPRTVPNTICLFERYAGDAAWRHSAETVEGRPKRDLVVRFAAVLGNYDYIFDWVFQQDGSIRVAVGATGIAEVKMVAARSALAAASDGSNGNTAPTADAYGRFVDRNIVAVNHDHYFNFRLDLDVDGSQNSFQRDALETVRLPDDHPRRSIWQMKSQVARTEREAMLNIDLKRPALWRVVNPRRTNHVGYPTSYQISPSTNVETLLSEDDYPRRRARFIDHHLWVTPYRADERYAAGLYPTLSTPGEGLPAWTGADRPIGDTDLVAWYTMGMHHVVRAEDWPVMPVLWRSFELRPFDFFDRNPALDLPKKP
jgi:primary-amine oxidase